MALDPSPIYTAVDQFAAACQQEITGRDITIASQADRISELEARVAELEAEPTPSDPAPAPLEVNPVAKQQNDEFVIDGIKCRAQSSNKPYALFVDADPEPTFSEHQLRQGDLAQMSEPRQRIEMRVLNYLPFNTSLWWGYSFRWLDNLPSGSFHIIGQFNQAPDAGDINPRHAAVFTLSLRPSGLSVYLRGDTAYKSTNDPNSKTVWQVPVPPRGRWDDLVFRSVLSKGSPTGELDIFYRGEQVYEGRNLVNAYNDDRGPYYKWGTYRDNAPETTRVQFANLRLPKTRSLADRITNPPPVPA